MAEKRSVHITRLHHTDLVVASMNFGEDGKAIWDRLNSQYEFLIDEKPVEGRFYNDFSNHFLYPAGAARHV